VRRLIEDMVETMEDAQGVGLAAPQVHIGKRIIIFKAPRATPASSIAATRPTARRSSASPRASMPASCSTRPTIWTASSTRCA
jgi:peptide deformylase